MICGKVVIALIAAMACAALAHATGVAPASGLIRAPDGKGGFIYREPTTDIEAAEAETPIQELPADIIPGPISYHGGPIMLGTTKVYRIWYGWQGGPPQLPNSPPFHTGWVMQGLILGLSGSPYFNINAAYYDGAGNHVSNSLIDGGSVYLPTSATFGGTSLTDDSIFNIVTSQIANHQLPLSAQTVYMVVTAQNVNETSGFCTTYCAWHNHRAYSGVDIKYAFIGDGDRCPEACQPGRYDAEGYFQPNCPTGDCAADGMANVTAHELSEAVTDPDLNAWYDASRYENADKCAWTFGRRLGGDPADSNVYDFYAGGIPFQIQENWVPTNGGCAMSH